MKNLILIISSLMIVSFSFVQNSSRMIKLGTILQLPMRNAEVFQTNYSKRSYTGCAWSMPIVTIRSKTDSVFSSCVGKVSAVFDLGDYECIVVRIDTNTFYSITQLNSVIVKKGQLVIKGTFIGKSNQDEEKKLYSITFMMADKNARYFSEQKIWKLLEQANQSECDNEEVIAFQ